MKHLLKVSALLLSLSIVFFISCEKEPDHYRIPEFFKPWTVFDTGSVWVYKYAGTDTIIDTFSITKIQRYIIPYPDKNFDYEVINMHFDSRLLYGISVYTLNHNSFFSSSADISILINGQSAFWTSSQLCSGMLLNPNENYGCASRMVGLYDSLNIGTLTFRNVIQTRTRPYLGEYMDFDCYFVEHIGIVRFNFNHNGIDSTWNLVSYRVVQ